MPDQRGFGNNGTESARPCQSGHGDDQMNEQDEEVAHPGNGISTSRTTTFRPIWQFAMDRCHGSLHGATFRRYNLGMSTSINRHPLTSQQEAHLRDDLAAVEEKLHGIAILTRACYGEDSQVAIRADETLCALQRFNWELERVQMKMGAAAGN